MTTQLSSMEARDNAGERPAVQFALWLASSHQDIPVSDFFTWPARNRRYADIYAFAKHLNERKCQASIACFGQTDKELMTIALPAEFKKGNIQ